MSFHRFEPGGDLNQDRLCFLDRVIKGLEGIDFSFHLGEPVSREMPKDPKIFMSKEYPGIALGDHIGNMKGMIVASPAFRKLIEAHCTGLQIEYLPFTLMDHKKRPFSSEYCIINVLGTFDCVDTKASDISYTPNGKVSRIRTLVLDGKKVASAPQLFHVDLWPSTYIMGPALSGALRQAKLKNVLLHEVAVSKA